jgi:hypothetical protein
MKGAPPNSVRPVRRLAKAISWSALSGPRDGANTPLSASATWKTDFCSIGNLSGETSLNGPRIPRVAQVLV